MKQEIEFASHPGNLSLMRDFVRQFLATTAFSHSQTDLLVLGLDEACTNIIRHAYGQAPGQLITLTCERAGERVCFRVRDYGEQRDPARMQGRPLEMVEPGGLGLHLIRRIFDTVDYVLKKQGTELVLTKTIESGGALKESACRPGR